MLLMFRFLFYHPTIRVAMLLTLKQYLVAGLGMVLIFFCIFNLTEQWESPRHQTLKQNLFTGLGMLLIFIFQFGHPTIRVAVLLEHEIISSCWTWYGTDISFPFLSPHYHIRRVIRIWNNIKLLVLVWYWFFSAFLISPNNESRLLSDTKTISSSWTWYATDNYFPILSPNYQSRRVIRTWNSIYLLDLVW